MTRDEFMYVVGYGDEELKNLMVLTGESEPENGDYTEMMKFWYDGMCEYGNSYFRKYCEAKKA